MAEQIPHLRIFISSPGDVNDERKIALEVIEQLPYRPTFREKVAFRVIAWDKPGAGTPMRATLTPQEAINQGLPTPAECDIVIVLFWSRMGTPVTDKDGTAYQSGTHWELLNALEAKRPETVIYRRTDKPPFDVTDRDFDAKHAQYKAVKAFFESDLFYGKDGSIRRGVNTYQTPDDFRRAFEIGLEVLVLEILNRLDTAPSPKPKMSDVQDDDNISTIRAVNWPPGKSPFPGLRAFEEQDASIFFGRGYETDALVRQLTNSRLVAVVGASGSGKSSLARAGLIPRLRANAILGSKEWIIIQFRPGDMPFVNLAEALIHGLPSLRLSDLLTARVGVVPLVEDALSEKPAWIEILIFIDQFEELFTLKSDEDVHDFATMLNAVTKSNRIRVVATMRHDFFNRAVENQILAELLRSDAVLSLAIPKRDALRQMIERPAERAGITFDHTLVDRILDDTGHEPGNLALMAYTLDELYKLDKDRHLTHHEYNQLEGVQGAIGIRAEKTFLSLGVAESVLHQMFHLLVDVDESGTATRRRGQFELEQYADEMQQLIRTFTDARLLTTNYDESSQAATIEIAHEAILRSWPRLSEWIKQNSEDMILLKNVRRRAQEWEDKGYPDYLRPRQQEWVEIDKMRQHLGSQIDEITEEFIARSEVFRLLDLYKKVTKREEEKEEYISQESTSASRIGNVSAFVKVSLERMGIFALSDIVAATIDNEYDDILNFIYEVFVYLEEIDPVESLIAQMSTIDDQHHFKIIRAFGEIGERAIESLSSLLQNDDANIRKCVVDALGAIASKQAVRLLIDSLQDMSGLVRAASAGALSSSKSLEAVDRLVDVLDDIDFHVRANAAESLGIIGHPKAVEGLITTLSDRYVDVRVKAIQSLSKIGDTRAVSPLVESLYVETNNDVSRAIMEALGKIDPHATEVIEWVSQEQIAPSIIEIVGKIGNPAIEPYIEKLNSDRDEIRKKAISDLVRIGESAVESLLDALGHENSQIRSQALAVLMKINTPEARQAVSDHLFSRPTR